MTVPGWSRKQAPVVYALRGWSAASFNRGVGACDVQQLGVRLLLLLALFQPVATAAGNPVSQEAARTRAGEMERELSERAERSVRDGGAAAGQVWTELGAFYHGLGRRHRAVELYNRAAGSQSSAAVRYLRGVALFELGQYEHSLPDLLEALAATPDNAPAALRAGRVYLLASNFAAAAQMLSRAAEHLPNDPAVNMTRGDLAAAQRQWKAALHWYRHALRESPGAGELALKLATAHRALGDVGQATRWLVQSSRNRDGPAIRDPWLSTLLAPSRSFAALLLAADWALVRGEPGKALISYERAARLEPADPAVAQRRALLLAEVGQQRLAITHAQRYLREYPDEQSMLQTLAQLLYADEVVSAPELAQMARRLRADQTSTPNRQLTAALFAAAGAFEEAAVIYRRLAGLDPQRAEFHYGLGLARLAAGNCDAREALATAARLQPDWRLADQMRARADAFCGAASARGPRTDTPTDRLTHAIATLVQGDPDSASLLARAELPHPDAALLLDAMAGLSELTAFAPDSRWWWPPLQIGQQSAN